MAPSSRAFVSRLASLPVFSPGGDQVGKLRDVVIVFRQNLPPRVVGLVVEVYGRRRIFLPIGRVTAIAHDQIVTTGVVNMRRFEQRATEVRILGDLLDRTVTVTDSGRQMIVFDAAIEQVRTKDWLLTKLAVTTTTKRFRRSEKHVVDWDEVTGLTEELGAQGAAHMLAAFDSMNPTDLAAVLHDLSPKRRNEVASALDDDRLADVLEELPEEDQVEILTGLDTERAADVLEEMSPDDAADLIAELPKASAEHLLELMEPDEAADVRRLMTYDETTAGGMMTTNPVILPPDATVADALAQVRHAEHSPALAAMVYVCRPPLETPTGRLLGVAHIQRLLREPPSELVSTVLDTDLDPLPPQASQETVARYLAAYNLVSLAVCDDENRLLGAVTVDDLLDHMLPEGWRDTDAPTETVPPQAPADAQPTGQEAVHGA